MRYIERINLQGYFIMHEFASLASYNTFGVDVKARYFFSAKTDEELKKALIWAREQNIFVYVIGGGSNVVLTEDLNGLVLLVGTKGIAVVDDDGDAVTVAISAGEVWHDVVAWSVNNGFKGIENLALIPGTAGAAPVQNIGAYGVEFSDVCLNVIARNRNTLEYKIFTAEECFFSYRNSIFKQQPEQWLVERITLVLHREKSIYYSYKPLQMALLNAGITSPNQNDVYTAVCHIRTTKLPDPIVLGNAGSFFKNPLVDNNVAQTIVKAHPRAPLYPYDEMSVKLGAGWLIEQVGWKGKSLGLAGVYEKQALVLVNHGGANGRNILALAEAIKRDVYQAFGVTLEMEPVIYPLSF